jgi:hypothetical protein
MVTFPAVGISTLTLVAGFVDVIGFGYAFTLNVEGTAVAVFTTVDVIVGVTSGELVNVAVAVAV